MPAYFVCGNTAMYCWGLHFQSLSLEKGTKQTRWTPKHKSLSISNVPSGMLTSFFLDLVAQQDMIEIFHCRSVVWIHGRNLVLDNLVLDHGVMVCIHKN